VQKDVLFGLQQGTKVLKEIQKEMGGIERVELLVGESMEAVAYQKEISEMLGGRISNADEDEVEDELEAMEAELTGVLPNVPTMDPPLRGGSIALDSERVSEEMGREAMLA